MQDRQPFAEQPTVMVIDDEPQVREVLRDIFEQMGCAVQTVGDPVQVPVKFLEKRPDLITLDYHMPGINGKGLHLLLSHEFGLGGRTVSSKRSNSAVFRRLPPILVITGYPDTDAVDALQFGESVVGVIAKPFRVAEIREAALLALAHYRREPAAADPREKLRPAPQTRTNETNEV